MADVEEPEMPIGELKIVVDRFLGYFKNINVRGILDPMITSLEVARVICASK